MTSTRTRPLAPGDLAAAPNGPETIAFRACRDGGRRAAALRHMTLPAE